MGKSTLIREVTTLARLITTASLTYVEQIWDDLWITLITMWLYCHGDHNLSSTVVVCHLAESFKSLASSTDKKEDAEFEQQRRAIIAEALQAKGESKKPKTFTKQVRLSHIPLSSSFSCPLSGATVMLSLPYHVIIALAAVHRYWTQMWLRSWKWVFPQSRPVQLSDRLEANWTKPSTTC